MTTVNAIDFVDDRHALYAGMVLGLMVKNGMRVWPTISPAGNYTPEVTVEIEGFHFLFIIPPPPEGWTVEGWLA